MCENDKVEASTRSATRGLGVATSGPFLLVAIVVIIATRSPIGQLPGDGGLLRFLRFWTPGYTATEFILQYPAGVKPKTIVEDAAKVGLTITASYASNVRSVAKKNGGLPTSGQGASNPKPSPRGSSATSAREDDETAFMRLLNRLGEERATKLIALYRAARSGK